MREGVQILGNPERKFFKSDFFHTRKGKGEFFRIWPPKNMIFRFLHENWLKVLIYLEILVNFGFFAPSPLVLGFSKFGCFTKMAQNTLLLRYLRLRFGFWPLAPNFLGYHLKNVKFPILTKRFLDI